MIHVFFFGLCIGAALGVVIGSYLRGREMSQSNQVWEKRARAYLSLLSTDIAGAFRFRKRFKEVEKLDAAIKRVVEAPRPVKRKLFKP